MQHKHLHRNYNVGLMYDSYKHGTELKRRAPSSPIFNPVCEVISPITDPVSLPPDCHLKTQVL